MSTEQQPIESPGDEWRTPPFVFEYINRQYGFVVDLAATDENTLCEDWFTRQRDALTSPWHEFNGPGFLNPPYSKVAPWLAKARAEAARGFTTVCLIPTPNGERVYDEHVIGKASELIFITGRLSFIALNGKPKDGNSRGSCFVIYRGFDLGYTRYSHIDRDVMLGAVTSWRNGEVAA